MMHIEFERPATRRRLIVSESFVWADAINVRGPAGTLIHLDARDVRDLAEYLIGWLLGADAPARLAMKDGVFSFTLPAGACSEAALARATRRLAE